MNTPAPLSDATIAVTEERLDVERRFVDTGPTLRLRKDVQEVPVNVVEPVAREYVEIQRVPVGRVLEAPVGVRREGDVMVVPVIEERLVTHKELVLVEEIHLTRCREVREDRQEHTLRRERVQVERLDPESGEWRPDAESER